MRQDPVRREWKRRLRKRWLQSKKPRWVRAAQVICQRCFMRVCIQETHAHMKPRGASVVKCTIAASNSFCAVAMPPPALRGVVVQLPSRTSGAHVAHPVCNLGISALVSAPVDQSKPTQNIVQHTFSTIDKGPCPSAFSRRCASSHCASASFIRGPACACSSTMGMLASGDGRS